MTIYSKRRGKRSLAAILAAMLAASVLAVVAGSPASAATTAFEVKVDHDNNAKTATVREFAGQDRYDTALRLAKNFATAQGGLGTVPAVFVASGETLVDSISVAGLAGYANAPILLTPTGSLHGGVKDFIEDYGVSTVYVLGGSAAISDAAVTAIEGLSNKPKVTRIAGADRYATAAAIAAMIKTGSNWCGSTAAGAVLINGATDMLGYGVAAQTVAYRLQMPVLMTAADELPDATADYISDNNIEHVQIIGGTDAVSADVAAALTTLGVDTVARTGGDSAAAVSVELAKLASNGCGDDLAPVSNNRVALVRANPDGVVGAPVLASSLTSGSLVPPLIVGDSLPASVRDYLAATPKTVGDDKLNLGIVAIGGTAAVSQATMDAALAAAASAGALTVTISAAMDANSDGNDANDPVLAGANSFALHFSDDVPAARADTSANATLLAKIRDVIEVNGLTTQIESVATATAAGACKPSKVTVTLAAGTTLKAGDTVSVAGSKLKFGSQNDQRTVAAASTTVRAVPADTARPSVAIVALAGGSSLTTQFTVRLSDDKGMRAATLTAADFEFAPGSGSTNTATSDLTVGFEAITANAKSHTVTVTLPNVLKAGARLTLKPGKVTDLTGNVNARTSGTAINAPASPRVTSVLMSQPKHSAQNSWLVPSAAVGDAVDNSNTAANAGITITAKVSGAAAGAAGNDWTITFDTPTSRNPAGAVDIDVRVDSKNKRAAVVFTNGTPTVGELVAAMNGDAEFSALFSAGTPCTATNARTKLAPSGTAANRERTAAITGGSENGHGRTQFAVEVRFSAYIASVNNTEMLADVLARTADRNRTDTDANTPALLTDLLGGAGGNNIVGGAPGTVARYEFTTANVAYMPRSGDLVNVQAGHNGASAITGPPAFPQILAVTAVATGYANDADPTPNNGIDNTGDATDKVDEDFNGASQRRIAVSSTVKARNS